VGSAKIADCYDCFNAEAKALYLSVVHSVADDDSPENEDLRIWHVETQFDYSQHGKLSHLIALLVKFAGWAICFVAEQLHGVSDGFSDDFNRHGSFSLIILSGYSLISSRMCHAIGTTKALDIIHCK
jgi:hypothetical protein